MGHINFDNTVKISNLEVVRNLPKITKPLNPICRHCQLGKKTRVRFKTKEYSTSKPLELVHSDLCGPTRTKSLQVESYFMLFKMILLEWLGYFSSKKNQKHLTNSKSLKLLLKMKQSQK